MSQNEKQVWTSREVNKLLLIACDEFEKEFYKALVASARKSRKLKHKPSLVNPAKIIAEAKARARKK